MYSSPCTKLAMVVVAGVALTSSTYAWFVNNGTVQATGMSVNATTDDSLLIKGSEDGQNYGSIGTANISELTMKPTTSSDGEKFARLGDDVKVESAHGSAATWSGLSGDFASGDLISILDSEKTTYYQEATYQIKSTTAATSFYVSGIEVTYGGASDLKKSIRVSVTVPNDDNTASITKVYKPAGDTTTNIENQVGSLNGSAWELIADTSVYTDANVAANIWTLPTANVEKNAVIRVWFEGQDTYCYTDAIDTTNNFGVTVTFTRYTAGA